MPSEAHQRFARLGGFNIDAGETIPVAVRNSALPDAADAAAAAATPADTDTPYVVSLPPAAGSGAELVSVDDAGEGGAEDAAAPGAKRRRLGDAVTLSYSTREDVVVQTVSAQVRAGGEGQEAASKKSSGPAAGTTRCLLLYDEDTNSFEIRGVSGVYDSVLEEGKGEEVSTGESTTEKEATATAATETS